MNRRRHVPVALAFAIVGLTIIVYWRTTAFAFINYDDHRYVTHNERVLGGLTFDNIAWAFQTFEFSNWHPLTWLSHMLDVEMHGRWAGGHHFTNVLLHAANAFLLMMLLNRMTRSVWRSALVAALFALHPLHVESVAWISERKDVLSTFFGLLAMLAYVRFARARSARAASDDEAGRPRSTAAYALVVLCFALSLMSKPMLVTLPFALLLLDWWPLRRLRTRAEWRPRIIEKVPLLVLSVASSCVTLLAQRAGGAISDFQRTPLSLRLANAIIAYGEYLWQTIWPARLAVFYPYPRSVPAWEMTVAAFTLVAITIACLAASRRSHRAPLMGWLWFLGTLVPVIGLVQVGAQAHADRYTYVPLIGVFIGFAWSLPASSRAAQVLSTAIASMTILALAMICGRQIGHWRDDAALGQRAIDATSNNRVGHLLLGNALMAEQRLDEAIAHLERATQIDATWADAWNNLGNAYARAGRNEEAIAAYHQAIALRPDLADVHHNLGMVLHAQDRLHDALQPLQRAIELNPDFAEARINLGAVLRDLSRMDEALVQFHEAVRLRPNDPVALINLGDALVQAGRIDEARSMLRRAADAAAALGNDALHRQALDLEQKLDARN